ncbi:MAG: flagellar motor protein PomA [Gammaproteobacteria bacterium]|nr:flagellar motor protein PomA [Gammaproteobacteria bacterium]
MDLATIIGIVGAFAMVLMAMVLSSGGDIILFFNVPSVLIVAVGSHFIILMKFSMGQFLGAAKGGMKILNFKSQAPEELIDKIVELADAARKGGLLSLESAEIPNEFMNKGINLLVDGHDGDVVKQILTSEVKMASERHLLTASIFKSLGDVAPAMGMIGTLIGLVAMLANMDDPKTIGPSMAVALLTTLYGAIIANMIAIPISEKCILRNDEEKMTSNLIIDGLLSIQSGQNPRVIEQALMGYIEGSKRPTGEEA